MTITDLKTYAERVNRKISPDDKFEVTLTRNALTYIGAILRDRKASLEQSLADPKIKPSKAAKRALELADALISEAEKGGSK